MIAPGGREGTPAASDLPADAARTTAAALAASGPLLVVLAGPSGAGKDAVRSALLQRGHPFHFAVTATTRAPRAGETDGIDYHFLTVAGFEALLAERGLLEHERYEGGHYYGVPRAAVAQALQAGTTVVIRTDVRGAASIKRLVPAAVTIMVYPPDLESLRRRMLSRRSETPESLAARMMLAVAELQRTPEFDYAVLNEDGALERAVALTEAIIAAERCRVGRAYPRLI